MHTGRENKCITRRPFQSCNSCNKAYFGCDTISGGLVNILLEAALLKKICDFTINNHEGNLR